MNSTKEQKSVPSDSTRKLRKKKRIFGWLFILSIVIFSGTLLLTQKEAAQTISFPLEDDIQFSEESSNSYGGLVVVTSLITSLLTLIGFLSTTILAWKKEKREVTLAKLEIRKQELELEKLRMERNKSN